MNKEKYIYHKFITQSEHICETSIQIQKHNNTSTLYIPTHTPYPLLPI